LLKGKCRHCGKPISWQYPIVEVATGFLFLWAFLANNQSSIINHQTIFNIQYSILFLIRDWILISVMIVIFIYDLRWYLILDKVTLPACLAVFILNLALGVSWLNLAVSAAIGSGFFLIQFLVSRGKWIGGGDIRLGLLMGLALGQVSYLVLAILLAYFAGSVVGLGLIAFKKKKWKSEIPLGVFLSSATVFTLFFGDRIINWYLSLF
jgi:prepilin signal peptidase PulO-like enzyme (type II secretory pathway)